MRQKLKNIREFFDRAKFKILLGALGLSIVMIVGLGGYIVGQRTPFFESFQAFKLTESPSPTPQPESSQTPTPTQTPVATTSTPTAQGTTATVTLNPSPQPISSQPTPSPTPTQTPTPTPTPTPISFSKFKFKLPFSVTGVTADVSPTKYTGSCSNPKKYYFTANITANAAGTVTYRWVWSNGHQSKFPYTIIFDGAGTKEAYPDTDTWIQYGVPGESYSGWAKVRILTPNTLESNQAKFSHNCT